MAVTALGPGGDAPGDVDDDVTLELLSQRPMVFQDSELEMQDRVDALETAVNDGADHGSRPKCAKMLRDIVFPTHLDVLCPALLGEPPAPNKPVAVRLLSVARVVWAKPPPERYRVPWSAAASCRDCRSMVTTIGVEVTWEGLEEAESTWEPVSRVCSASTVLRRELKALRLKTDQRRGLVQRYGPRFVIYCG